MTIPEQWNLLLCGGRGGGKSVAIQFLVQRYVEKYGKAARVLIVRETYKGIEEFEDNLVSLLKDVYPTGVRHNKQDHKTVLPTGAQVEIGQLACADDYKKYQGHSYTMLVLDEYGVMKTPKWANLLRSNMRGSAGVPLVEIRAANPGGAQHTTLHRKFILASQPWVPFDVDGETWVWVPSTLKDNPHNGAAYEKRIRNSTTDPDLVRAWIEGDWNIRRGAYFGDVLSEKDWSQGGSRISIKPEQPDFNIKNHERFITLDWGGSAPSAAYLVLRSRGEWLTESLRFPRGSLILLDEVHSCVGPDELNQGKNWTPDKLAEAMASMCARWGLRAVPGGVGDDYKGFHLTLLQYLANYGIYLQRPIKGPGSREGGWLKMRQMFFNAKELNRREGLWVNDRCQYFWLTVPDLQRDDNQPEDINTDGPDHAADAVRYAVMQWGPMTQARRTI
jgi:hypothetical protein